MNSAMAMQQGSPAGNRAASPDKGDREPPGGCLSDPVSEVIVSLVIILGLAPLLPGCRS
jgi:hypothetical protein